MIGWFLIFAGGGLGSLARFGISRLNWLPYGCFPAATLLSNILSSFLLGLFIAFTFEKLPPEANLRLFFFTGFCGGFSTFSTFSFETVQLLSSGKWLEALANIFLNLILCFGAVALGLYLYRN